MIFKLKQVMALVRALAAVLAMGLLAPAAAHAGQYLPLTLTDVAAADKAVVANPAPVQLLFEFKTKGAPNPQATAFLSKAVTDYVKATGVFSEVTTGPAEGGAILLITLENVPEDGAFGKGFATGLTFGLAGTTVVDYYICTLEFSPGPGQAKVTKEVRHSIITTVGLAKAPQGVVKAKNLDDAVKTMTRQVVSNGVNDLAKDPGFLGGAATEGLAVESAAPEDSALPAPAPEAAPATGDEPAPAADEEAPAQAGPSEPTSDAEPDAAPAGLA